MASIFISYVQEDGDAAREIAGGLERAGYSVWYYERDSLPGRSYLEQVQEVIDRADAVVVIVSPAALGSSQVNVEISEAHVAGKPFAPLLRDITYATLNSRRRSWAMMFGTAVAAPLPQEDPGAIVPRLVSGLQSLGVDAHPTPETAATETGSEARDPKVSDGDDRRGTFDRRVSSGSPDGGASPAKPLPIASAIPAERKPASGMAALVLGYFFALLSFVVLPIVFTPVAIGIAIYNMRNGRMGHGVAQIILAVLGLVVGILVGLAMFS